jgi:hypothetical protein
MLEENSNPNTNNQVPEGQCLPAGQCLAQRKRSQPVDGQSTIAPLANKKSRRLATLANHRQNCSKVNVNKALRVNILAAVGELVSQDSEIKTSRVQISMTELLVFLVKHVRLDDGTRFKVDLDNNYEITKVHDPHTIFCMFALICFDFLDKSEGH